MEKMNCDIIRDLIPSYADDICSEATRQCVQEHLASCDGCRQMLETYKSHTLSGKKLERKGLDGLKEIRKTLKFQSALCYLTLIFLVYCGIEIFLANHTGYVIFSRPTLLGGICIIITLLSGIDYQGKTPVGKLEYLLGGLSLAMDLYFIGIFFYLAFQLKPGTEKVFGIELLNLGPFLEKQLIVAFVAQAAFFIYSLWCIIRKDKNCNWLLCLYISGIFLMIMYDIWMKRMDSFETLKRSITRYTLEILVMGVLGVGASLLIARISRKKLR